MTKVPLSKRVRPTSEVPQYVYDEIVALETERDEARAKITELIGLLHRDCTECRDYPTHECRTCRLLREFAEEQ